MITATTAVILLTALTAGSAGTSTRPTPNTLSGRVLDAAGKPVAGAEVWIQPVSYSGLIKVRTDAQGRYQSVELNSKVAPYRAQAYKVVNYHGEKTCVRLGGETETDFDVFNPKAGAVRNFHWKMQGEAEGGYDDQTWGGNLRFYKDPATDAADMVRSDEVLEVRLVPNGPLIDGSKGKALAYTISAGQGVKDIPVGRYDLSAFVVNKDGTKTPLKLKADNDVQKTAWSNKITILFDGLSSCGHYATYHSTPIAIAH